MPPQPVVFTDYSKARRSSNVLNLQRERLIIINGALEINRWGRFNTLLVIATYYCRPPANRRLPQTG